MFYNRRLFLQAYNRRTVKKQAEWVVLGFSMKMARRQINLAAFNRKN